MIATYDRPIWQAICQQLDRRNWAGDRLLRVIIETDLRLNADFPTLTVIIPKTLEDRLEKPLAVAQVDRFVRSLAVGS